MSKQLTIQQIEDGLQEGISKMEELFPFGITLSIIGIDERGLGYNFVLSDSEPEALIECIKNAYSAKRPVKKASAKKKAPSKKK
jgi:hypothetical protein